MGPLGRLWPRRLRGVFPKYALVISLVVGMTAAASGAVQGYFAYQEKRDSIGDVQRGQAALIAANIRGSLAELEAQLRLLLPELDPSGGRTSPPLVERLDDFERVLRQAPLAYITFIDNNQFVRAVGVADDPAGVQLDATAIFSAGKEVHDEARLLGVSYGRESFVTDATGDLSFYIAVGVRGFDGGVVAAGVETAALTSSVRRIDVGEKGLAYVVDRLGAIIAASGPNSPRPVGLSYAPDPVIADALARPLAEGESGEASQLERDGESLLTSHETIAGPGWTVVVEQPASEALAPLTAIVWRTVGIMAGGVALALIASVLLARQMVVPIRALERGAARVAEGDLDHEIRVRSHDELGTLAGQFNLMTARLRDSYATLEQKVERRTVDLGEALRALEVRSQQLEEASRHKSTFVANMSHELRTPLNAIIGYSEMLKEEATDSGEARTAADLDKILASANHLLALINDILDLSRVEAGRMAVVKEDVDVVRLLSQVEPAVQPLMAKNGNRFVIDCPPDIGSVSADQTKLRQALLNLVSNAAKFTDHGTVTLAVGRRPSAISNAGSADSPLPAKGERAWDEGDLITFSVSDTGIGMTPEQMGRLFQPFTQAEDSTFRKYGGTGLGLAISREFCRLMGGDITVDSESGKGSTFRIVLPSLVGEPPVSAGEPAATAPALIESRQ